MPRLGLLLALIVTLATAAATTATAVACPATAPGGPRCTKYDFMFDAQEMAPYATVYVRAQRGILAPRPRSARVLRHLLGSTWLARDPAATVKVVHFLDAQDVPDVVDDAVHNTILHGVAWRGDHYEVVIDNIKFGVQRCRDDRGLLTTCLVRLGVVRLAE